MTVGIDKLPTPAVAPRAPQRGARSATWAWDDDADEPPVRALDVAQAASLKSSLPMLSPWRVLGWQLLAGLLCCAVISLWMQERTVLWSAVYGMAAVLLPGALLARGMTKRVNSAAAAAAGFMFWEFLKLGASIAMLMLATRIVPGLVWPALLAAMVVCIKVNWLALVWRGR